jgi:hypothetical protein
MMTRTRSITQEPKFDGNKCSKLSQMMMCNTESCPVHCEVSGWTSWAACNADCGGGLKQRTRKVTVPAAFSGDKCPSLKDTAVCNVHPCPVHCKVSNWGDWGKCNAECGGGKKHRTRTVTIDAKFEGDVCPSLTAVESCNTQPCPVHCVVSDWSTYSACTKSCGTGTKSRKRTVTVDAKFDGNPCPRLAESGACNEHKCPVDCAVGAWTKWGACSKSCELGQQKRERTISKSAAHGGKGCPALAEKTNCNSHKCPVDCAVTAYSKWAECTKSCGTGSQVRRRMVKKAAAFGGKVCPSLRESQDCNTQKCPIDCAVSSWGDWAACSATCGGGNQARARSISTRNAHGGKVCPALGEKQACNIHSCPVHCIQSNWSGWSVCTKTCGTGTKDRTRSVLTKADHGGNKCGTPSEKANCNEHMCPIDCVVTAFAKWSVCSKSCAKGMQIRYRKISTNVAFGGKKCPNLTEKQTCSEQACPVDCVVGSWVAWSECSKSCAAGTQTRSRKVTTAAAFGGVGCAELSQSQSCTDGACPIHCQVSAFSSWTTCTKTCGGGSQARSRTVVTHAKHGGYTCPLLSETQKCSDDACPVDCVVSAFTEWASCSKSCGTGDQSRKRTVTTKVAYGGKKCPELAQTQDCNSHNCPVDCVVSSFAAWSDCSKSCGTGSQTRERSIKTNVAYGGRKCDVLSESQSCNKQACPVDCVVSKYGAWSECSKSCGTGSQSQSRSININVAYGGKKCPGLKSTRACNKQACPVDCVVSKYGAWSECSKSCGTGDQSRKRTVTTKVAYGGKKCPELAQTQDCNTDACAVDCAVSFWSEWDKCSVTCGTGTTSHKRKITTSASFGGKVCPKLYESKSCARGPCPVHCKVSEWGKWGVCSLSCGKGSHGRSRVVVKHPRSGGYVCPSLKETRNCNQHPCPVDCKLSSFTSWTSCTRSCGTGNQKRARTVSTSTAYGGKACEHMSEVRKCNTHACPVDCIVSRFGGWSVCTKSCGTGSHERSRTTQVPSLHGGRACPSLKQTRQCNAHNCPIDCSLSSFSAWSTCSHSCGSGDQTRARKILGGAAYGGKICSSLKETRNCNSHDCAIDCVVTKFGNWNGCSKTCGGGSHSRTRSVTTKADFGGKVCPGLKEAETCRTQKCPIDCVLTKWGGWTACTKTCDIGIQRRYRSASTAPAFGGKACATTSEKQFCNTTPCKVHCEVSGWSAFGACTRSCGTGTKARARSVTTGSKHGGDDCPTLKDNEACNKIPCPVDCVVSAWATWTACPKSCGSASQTRTRTTTVKSAYGGKKCALLGESKACATWKCPKDCHISEWQDWGKCSKTCGQGIQKRSRSIRATARYGGKACPKTLSESKVCLRGPCPIHCKVSTWSEWEECSKSCGAGIRTRSREVLQLPTSGGYVCPELSEIRRCNEHSCPLDCEVSSFGSYSECSVTCGGGLKSRTRVVTTKASHGGKVCPALKDSAGCNSAACPVDCVVSAFSKWNTCTKSCGSGQQTKTREISQKALYGGKVCPGLSQTQSCNDEPCAIDCVVSLWGEWDDCSHSCGTGEQKRTRTVTKPSKYGGKACPTALTQAQVCHAGPCPVHCEVSIWGAWADCPKTCGKAVHTRSRVVIQHAAHGGYVCPTLAESRTCNDNPCPVDCVMTAFGAWPTCDKSCCLLTGSGSKWCKADNAGKQSRYRSILSVARFGGKKCQQPKQTQDCNTHACPVDCVPSAWGVWADCSKSCGHGTQNRERNIITPAAHGGKCTALRMESRSCNAHKCAEDCKVSAFSAWSSCSKTCGVDSSRSRTRSITSPAYHGGKTCPHSVEKQPCSEVKCPIDCELSEFSSWTACTKTCGTGLQKRSRSVVTYSLYGGTKCASNKIELRSCVKDPCPVDCAVSLFSGWNACNKSCNTGSQTRTRHVQVVPQFGGRKCPALSQNQACNGHKCPEDCDVGPWASWSKACSKSCGSGKKDRARAVRSPAYYGGKKCPELKQTKVCNAQTCPIDCKVSLWSDWGDCSASCGSGEQMRARAITGEANYGGKACPELRQKQNCESGPCPIHCDVSAWGVWSACSASCGTKGKHNRSRRILTHAKHGGYQCPDLWESRSCNTHECPLDCVVSSFEKFGACSKSCGSGSKKRTRSVMTAPKNGGIRCPPLRDTARCMEGACPVDCTVTNWGEFGECSKTCSGGVQIKMRQIKRNVKHGGKRCPSLRQSRKCNTQQCSCSHVSCKFMKHSVYSVPIIRVFHDKLEKRGDGHVCNFNHATKRCECICHFQ